MRSSTVPREAIAKAGDESLRFARRPALHIVTFRLAYQLSALRIADILSHLPVVYAPDPPDFASQ